MSCSLFLVVMSDVCLLCYFILVSNWPNAPSHFVDMQVSCGLLRNFMTFQLLIFIIC